MRDPRRRDPYICWAFYWGRGPVKVMQLPITKAWVVGEDETHLAKTITTYRILTFTTKKSAERIAQRANAIIGEQSYAARNHRS